VSSAPALCPAKKRFDRYVFIWYKERATVFVLAGVSRNKKGWHVMATQIGAGFSQSDNPVEAGRQALEPLEMKIH